jgi:hypothetical protein
VGYALVTALFVFAFLFGILVVASMIVGIVRNGNSLLYGTRLSMPAQISPADVGQLPPGLRLASWPAVRLEIRPTVTQMVLRSAIDLVPLVAFICGLGIIRAFMRSVLQGAPFGSENVRRLRALGFLLVVGAPIIELILYGLRQALFTSLPSSSIDLAIEGLSIPGAALLAGLAAFILAEVFAHGQQLREDVEATI